MSKKQNQLLRNWEVVEDSLRRKVHSSLSDRLSNRDCSTYSCAILLQAMALVDVLADRSLCRVDRIIQWGYNTSVIHPTDVGVALKSLTLFFRNYFSWNQRALDYSGFKRHFRATIPFIGDFMSPIKEEVENFLIHPDPSCFQIINLHLSFMSRLSLADIDFSVESQNDYLETERHLETVELDNSLLSQLNSVMREWLQDFSYEGYQPSHGPGSVAFAKSRSKDAKFKQLKSDELLNYFLQHLPDECGDYSPYPLGLDLDRTCKVVFVPKSVTSWRTISMEPASLQYYQQGIWNCLDRFMTRHSFLRCVVDIHSQDRNRSMAKKASAEGGSFATIDLSAASDTVSWDLVKQVFRGTRLLRGCYATRSRHALLPDGTRVSLRKFAPMGSALCFPIECLIFAAVCEITARSHGIYRDASCYSVYGDDIVIRHDLASDLIYNLEKCGFIVNTKKSFIARNLPFRESCGGEYFLGVNVSTFRLSRKFSSERITSHSPNSFQAYVTAANLCQQHGLKTARLWFIHRLFQLPKKLQPYFSDDGLRGLFTPTPTNFHLQKKFSKDWQGEYLVAGEIVSQIQEEDVDETIRLFEWLRLARFRHQLIMPDDVILGNTALIRPSLQPRRISLA